MKALEESQAAAKRQMEDEDDLADLRQRNARLERGDVDLAEVLRSRHEARDREAEERRRREQEEDEEVVKQFFYKVKKPELESINEDGNKPKTVGVGLGDGYGSSDDEEKAEEQATVTVKRTLTGTSAPEPTVQDLLAAKGIALPSSSKPAPAAAKPNTLGIKRKDGASGLGVKLVKKKKLV
jgi:hypothetical protein